jgi:O-antigen/teichoic acid export membrane protein
METGLASCQSGSINLSPALISKKFIKSSIIYTVAGALPMASAIILLPFYIDYLPKEVYGALAIGMAISAFVQILSTYSFDSSLYIHYHEFKHDRNKLNHFVSSAFVFMLMLGAVIGLIAFLVGGVLFSAIYPNSTLSFYPYGYVAVGTGIFQAIVKVHSNLLQTRERPELFLWSNLLLFTAIAITTVAGLKLFPGSLAGPLGGRLISFVLVSIWVLFRIFKEFGFHFSNPWKEASFSFNAYTFVYQIQQWVINYFDRFVVLFFMPVGAMASVGIYDFAIKCLAPLELFLNGINQSSLPQVIKQFNNQPKEKSTTPEINRYYYGQVSIMLLAICGAVLVLPWLLDWFVRKSDYTDVLSYTSFIAVLFIMRAIRLYFGAPYSILKYMKQLTAINFVLAVVKIGLMIVLVQQYSVMGIIYASAVAALLEIVLLWIFIKEKVVIKFNSVKMLIVPLLLGVIIFTGELLIPVSYRLWAHLGYCLLCGLLLMVAYRNEWNTFAKLWRGNK